MNATQFTLYLVRHAQSTNNAQPESQRIPDPPLTDLGEQQAQALALAIDQLSPDHLFSSPFLRTLQTTAPVAQALGSPRQSEPTCTSKVDVIGAIASMIELPSRVYPDRRSNRCTRPGGSILQSMSRDGTSTQRTRPSTRHDCVHKEYRGGCPNIHGRPTRGSCWSSMPISKSDSSSRCSATSRSKNNSPR